MLLSRIAALGGGCYEDSSIRMEDASAMYSLEELKEYSAFTVLTCILLPHTKYIKVIYIQVNKTAVRNSKNQQSAVPQGSDCGWGKVGSFNGLKRAK